MLNKYAERQAMSRRMTGDSEAAPTELDAKLQDVLDLKTQAETAREVRGWRFRRAVFCFSFCSFVVVLFRAGGKGE